MTNILHTLNYLLRHLYASYRNSRNDQRHFPTSSSCAQPKCHSTSLSAFRASAFEIAHLGGVLLAARADSHHFPDAVEWCHSLTFISIVTTIILLFICAETRAHRRVGWRLTVGALILLCGVQIYLFTPGALEGKFSVKLCKNGHVTKLVIVCLPTKLFTRRFFSKQRRTGGT